MLIWQYIIVICNSRNNNIALGTCVLRIALWVITQNLKLESYILNIFKDCSEILDFVRFWHEDYYVKCV